MKYRHLPGKKSGLGHWITLWMGEDHLLAVDSNGYSESYTRYYYKDIKAIVARRTNGMLIWNGILGAALFFCLIILFSSSGAAAPWTVTMTILAAAFLAGIVVNTLLGPTCRCTISMPLGVYELPTLKRIRSARKALDLLRPLVAAIQGPMPPPHAFAGTAAPPERRVEPVHFSAMAEPPEAGESAAPYGGGAHYAAFSLLIAQALSGVTAMEFQGAPFKAFYGVLTFCLFVCLVAAVIKQRSRTIPRLAGRMVWTAIISLTCSVFSAYYAGAFMTVLKTGGKESPAMDVTVIASDVAAHPYFPLFIISLSIWGALLGVAGIYSLIRDKGRSGPPGTAGADRSGDLSS
jgi:hypothetical protein